MNHDFQPCPRCGLVNTGVARHCDCGAALAPGVLDASPRRAPASRPDWRLTTMLVSAAAFPAASFLWLGFMARGASLPMALVMLPGLGAVFVWGRLARSGNTGRGRVLALGSVTVLLLFPSVAFVSFLGVLWATDLGAALGNIAEGGLIAAGALGILLVLAVPLGAALTLVLVALLWRAGRASAGA